MSASGSLVVRVAQTEWQTVAQRCFSASTQALEQNSAAGTSAVPSQSERAAAAAASGDWRAFGGDARVGGSEGIGADELNIRIGVHVEDVVGLGDRLALPAAFAEHTWEAEEDPLHRLGLGFNPAGVAYEGMVALTRVERENDRFRSARLVADVASLDLPPVAGKWLKEILGPRMDWKSNHLRITCKRHASAAENRREALEQLSAACRRARELADELGDFAQRGPIDKEWGASQRRKRRARGSNPTRPPFTLHPVARTNAAPQGPPLQQLLRLKAARMAGRPFAEDVVDAVDSTATASRMLEEHGEDEEGPVPRAKRRGQAPRGKGKGKR